MSQKTTGQYQFSCQKLWNYIYDFPDFALNDLTSKKIFQDLEDFFLSVFYVWLIYGQKLYFLSQCMSTPTT